MPDREERIPARYKETFDWIYDENASHEWTSFAHWLKDDSRIYWVTGKPGAGKSTLLKFLHQDPRTLEIFESSIYARGGNEVIVGAFFFWNSGSMLQRSQEGMLRTLLHQCLSQCNELIPLSNPALYERYYILGTLPSPDVWTWNELSRSFDMMLERGASKKNFLLFIDGLDEFSGNHEQLIALLQSKAHLPNVKICVASRPWPVFEDAFHQAASLRIHDLTYPDINHYTRERFYSNPGFKSLQGEDPEYSSELVEQIVQKSEGVFLWVTLVVTILLQDLTNGSCISDLQKHVEEIPPDLENFFDTILSSIQQEHFTHASQLFQLVGAAVLPPKLLELSFFDDDPKKVMNLPIRALPQDQANARADRIRRRIHNSCKGLLDTGNPFEKNLSQNTVQYLHRSVKDFIRSPSVQARLLAATGSDFDPYSTLALITFTGTKVMAEVEIRAMLQCVVYADTSAMSSDNDHGLLLDIIDQFPAVIKVHKLSTIRQEPYRLLSSGASFKKILSIYKAILVIAMF
jgi:hypothetical protein